MSEHTKQTSENLTELQSPQELFRKFGHLSMMGRRRFIKNLNLAQSLSLDIGQHSIVECGVWRGGASFAMMDLLPECPEFHLFDSFEGLPEPSERDGQKAIQLSEENLFVEGRNYASYDQIIEAVNKFGFSDRTTVHKGWFDETVFAKRIDRPIGILRLDGDWYDSTKVVLDRLFDSVATGGLIIVDDYFDWPGCSQAVHDFLSEQKLPDAVRTFDNLVAHIVKKPSDYLGGGAGKNELARRRKNKSLLEL
jgi:O-methyltransferase